QQYHFPLLHTLLRGLNGAIEGEKARAPAAIGVGEDAVALGVTLAANAFGRRSRIGKQHGHVAIGLGTNLLRALTALGAELRRLALPLRLHPLIDGEAVLLGQIRP